MVAPARHNDVRASHPVPPWPLTPHLLSGEGLLAACTEAIVGSMCHLSRNAVQCRVVMATCSLAVLSWPAQSRRVCICELLPYLVRGMGYMQSPS